MDVTVHAREINNPEVEVFSLVVHVDVKRRAALSTTYFCVQKTHLFSTEGSILEFQLQRINFTDRFSQVVVVDAG